MLSRGICKLKQAPQKTRVLKITPALCRRYNINDNQNCHLPQNVGIKNRTHDAKMIYELKQVPYKNTGTKNSTHATWCDLWT